MRVIFFARAREAAGCSDLLIESAQPLTQPELWDALVAELPALAPLRKVSRLARGETYLEDGETIQPGDEIVVIPPVSGG